MITLVLGGTRSGKSAVAERLAAASTGPVTYLATARIDSADADHVARIERHRARRPGGWATVECPASADLGPALLAVTGTALVDSIGTWLSAHPTLQPDVDALIDALRSRDGDTILVSEEVGLAVHATTELGRAYVDALGGVNQTLAVEADRALLVVAGRTLELPGP